MRYVLVLLMVVGFAAVAQACDRCGDPFHTQRSQVIEEEFAAREFGRPRVIIDDHREIVTGRVVKPFREERVLSRSQFDSFEGFDWAPRQREIYTRGGCFGGFSRGRSFDSFDSFSGFSRSGGCFGGFARRGLLGGPIIGDGLAGRILFGRRPQLEVLAGY